MSDIETKALEWLNKARVANGFKPVNYVEFDDSPWDQAFRLSLEAHEADKARHATEMREQAERFSEAVKEVIDRRASPMKLRRFILAPVDPLLGVVEEAIAGTDQKSADQLRAALEARGLAIVSKEKS